MYYSCDCSIAEIHLKGGWNPVRHPLISNALEFYSLLLDHANKLALEGWILDRP